VDDLLGITSSSELWTRIISEMANTFKLTDAGLAKWLLGTFITVDEESITMSQSKYVDTLLAKYDMQDCKPVSTPILGSTLEQLQAEEQDRKTEENMVNRTHYMSAVGGLIYLSVVSRPDISYAVSKAGQHMADPTMADMIKVKRIFRYLKGTSNYMLKYHKNGNTELMGYSDADWAGDQETRKSTSGYVFLLAGAAISWSSKRQQSVALSSTEAEYMAMSGAIQEAVYLKTLLVDLKYNTNVLLHLQNTPLELHVDNQSAMKIAQNNITSNRTKHIDIRYHYCREKVQDGTVKLVYTPTTDMLADILTKAVGTVILKNAVPHIMGMVQF
jgi:hypothetical protein